MSRESPDHLPARLWLMLAGLTFAWGFNWTAMKVALGVVPPWTFRVLCLGLGAAVLFGVLRAGGQKLGVPKDRWIRLCALSFFNITCWNVLVAFGLTMIPSGRASILAFTMPAWSIPLSIWLLGERITPGKWVGLTLGMLALALLLGESYAQMQSAPLGSLLVLGAAVSWAVGVVLQKRYPPGIPPGPYTAWMLLLGCVPIVPCALLFEDPRTVTGMGLWPALSILYTVLIAFAWANWAAIKIATSVPVAVFSLSTLVIPVVGVICGMVFLGERPSAAEYGALLLVIGSLVSVMVPARQAR